MLFLPRLFTGGGSRWVRHIDRGKREWDIWGCEGAHQQPPSTLESDVTSGGAHPRVLLQLGAVKVNISEAARSAPKNHTHAARRVALHGGLKFQSDGELSAFERVISTRESEVLRALDIFI